MFHLAIRRWIRLVIRTVLCISTLVALLMVAGCGGDPNQYIADETAKEIVLELDRRAINIPPGERYELHQWMSGKITEARRK